MLLVGFAFPMWGEMRDAFPPEDEAVAVHLIAEQFAWNAHYPGPDGRFGARDAHLVDPATNPIGLWPDDPNGRDDLVMLGELHLPAGRPAVVHLSSKDVIHSFALPEMRVKQDVIPGLNLSVWFVPTRTGDYEIACAQLCGIGHYRMRGYLTVHTPEVYRAWLDEAAAAPAL